MTGGTLPLWAAIVVAVGSPLVSFLGVWLGLRRTATSEATSDRRLRHEEFLRNVRWAADLATAGDDRAAVGVAVLRALRRSARDPGSVLEDEDRLLIEAVLATVEGPAVQAYSSGDTVEEE